jgi:hypothetical protein
MPTKIDLRKYVNVKSKAQAFPDRTQPERRHPESGIGENEAPVSGSRSHEIEGSPGRFGRPGARLGPGAGGESGSDGGRAREEDAASAWRRRETNRSGECPKLLARRNLCVSASQLSQNVGLTNWKGEGTISEIENCGLFETRLSTVRSEREGALEGAQRNEEIGSKSLKTIAPVKMAKQKPG